MSRYVPTLGGAGKRKGGMGVNVDVYGVDTVQAELNRIHKSLRPNATSELRQGTKEIGREVLLPELEEYTRWSPTAKLAHAIWETGTVRSDRIVHVDFGRKKPAISGIKQGRAKKGQGYANKRSWGTLAWGSELGPKGGGKTDRAGLRGGARKGVNYYGAPRNESGYWVQPALKPGAIGWRAVRDAYVELVMEITRKWG